MKTKKGFTLVELVMYAAIVGILFFVVVSTLILILKLNQNSKISRAIQEDGLAAIERVSREIRAADSIDQAKMSDPFLTPPGTLHLNSRDENGNPVVFRFYKWSGNLNIRKDGVLYGPILRYARMTIDFHWFPNQEAGTESVRLIAYVNYKGRTEQFYTTVILKGSYAE